MSDKKFEVIQNTLLETPIGELYDAIGDSSPAGIKIEMDLMQKITERHGSATRDVGIDKELISACLTLAISGLTKHRLHTSRAYR